MKLGADLYTVVFAGSLMLHAQRDALCTVYTLATAGLPGPVVAATTLSQLYINDVVKDFLLKKYFKCENLLKNRKN